MKVILQSVIILTFCNINFFLKIALVYALTHRKSLSFHLLVCQVKGYSQSSLAGVSVPPTMRKMYERVGSAPTYLLHHIFIIQVWDEADYVVPPAENGAFFVTTNVVITPNQTWGECPEVNCHQTQRKMQD